MTKKNPPHRLRLGMVGGGQRAFIGAVHRMAARLDNQFDFVAAALSADPALALSSGQALGLAADRIYESYTQMLEREATRPDRHRRHRHRHAEPPALPRRKAAPGRRLPRHLRQADDCDPGRRRRLVRRDKRGKRLSRAESIVTPATQWFARRGIWLPMGRSVWCTWCSREYPQGRSAAHGWRKPATARPRGALTRRAATPPAA